MTSSPSECLVLQITHYPVKLILLSIKATPKDLVLYGVASWNTTSVKIKQINVKVNLPQWGKGLQQIQQNNRESQSRHKIR